MFDRPVWEDPEDGILQSSSSFETLRALDARLRSEHAQKDHGGQRIEWSTDDGGIYCAECLGVGRHFNMRPFRRFVRVSDGFGNVESIDDIPYLTT